MQWIDVIQAHGTELIGPAAWSVVWNIVKIVCIALPIILCVAYLTYWERKMIGWMHVRPAPTAWVPRGCCSRSPTC